MTFVSILMPWWKNIHWKQIRNGNIAQVEHSRHRCFDNFIVNLLGAIAAYCMFPKKPCINVQRTVDTQLSLFWIHRTHVNNKIIRLCHRFLNLILMRVYLLKVRGLKGLRLFSTMQSFAWADAKLCVGGCNALRGRLQCFAWELDWTGTEKSVLFWIR